MSNDYAVSRYDNALFLLPGTLKLGARELFREQRGVAEEIRLRIGRRMTVLVNEEEIEVGERCITKEDIHGVIELATRASIHTNFDSMNKGYITAPGGYRIGICGVIGTENGQNFGFRKIFSLNIRISREIIGCSDLVLPFLFENGHFLSTLIISPPGFGKTTLLRDLIRNLSDGNILSSYNPLRVAVCDERGEICGQAHDGIQMNVGAHTDVLEGVSKAEGIFMLLRAMNPQVIAIDEITAAEDISAIESASNCGVRFLATAHAYSDEDLENRNLYKKLLDFGVFKNIVFIDYNKKSRAYRYVRWEDRHA